MLMLGHLAFACRSIKPKPPSLLIWRPWWQLQLTADLQSPGIPVKRLVEFVPS